MTDPATVIAPRGRGRPVGERALVCVGVHVHAEPARLLETLAALETHSPGAELLLLPDGPDRETAEALRTLRHVRRSGTAEPKGPPACFNRLARETDAAVLVLLESGSVVGLGWLDLLLAALDAHPRHGLAGPSTNLAWNEQGAFPQTGRTNVEIAATTRLATERFGYETRLLAPLHSLADFCLAVRREVVDAVGEADEGYGLGPCWEMDYSARALRAGFFGVWACGAYVHRSPITLRRAESERRLLQANKRRYQDRLCGRRLRGETGVYESHCRGEDCADFAPPGLIRLQKPLRERSSVPAPQAAPASAPPLVSCVMPTGGRVEFALQAVVLFMRQEYPERELVIVDDGDGALAALLPDDPRIVYARCRPGLSIGAKRNLACERARGALLAQWDDDDWYGADRLTVQAAPILGGEADITGLRCTAFLALDVWECWTCDDPLHRRLFAGDVAGGTLVFRRGVWEQLARYPETSLAEDAGLLGRAVARGARLARLDGEGRFVYVRHGTNSWRLTLGRHVQGEGWSQRPEPALPPEDRLFLRRMAHLPETGKPLVTCVMPTADRRRFVPLAIAWFQRQDYPHRELIILDDGRERVGDLVPVDTRIRYIPLDRPHVLGAKRNLGCELARGELIAHWDDDDWQAPYRLRTQVDSLLRTGAVLSGSRRLLLLEQGGLQAWEYEYPSSRGRRLAGASLCYSRSLWRRNPFPEIRVGEDTRFVADAGSVRTIDVDDQPILVAIVHRANTSPKAVSGPWFTPYPVEEIARIMGDDFKAYGLSDLAQKDADFGATHTRR